MQPLAELVGSRHAAPSLIRKITSHVSRDMAAAAIYIFLATIAALALALIIIPIVFACYLGYITMFDISFWELDFYSKYAAAIKNLLAKILTVEKNFPVEFIDKSALDPSGAYMYVFYPHGVLATTHAVSILSTATPLAPYMENTKHAVHSLFFRIPIIRELAALLGVIPASKSYMEHYARQGHSLTINPSGVRDVRNCHYRNKGCDILHILKRKGYIRIAKSAGLKIVPIYCWNEQALVRHGGKFTNISNWLRKYANIRIDWNSLYALLPTNLGRIVGMLFGSEPGTTAYVGRPIPVDGPVEDIQTDIIDSLEELFEMGAGASGRSLVIE